MAFTAAEIMQRATDILQDGGNVRWPLAELAKWIDDGVRSIVLVKPSASARSRILELAIGTLQRVPNTGNPLPLALIDVVRNLASSAESPRAGGRMIRPTTRALLDVQEPYWHDTTKVPFRKEVRSFLFDEMNPLEFYVFPGNDGTGFAEIVVSTIPAKLTPTGTPLDIASWGTTIGLPDLYDVPLLDFVLYRAWTKDDPGRAAGHYQAFANAMGIKVQTEAAVAAQQKA